MFNAAGHRHPGRHLLARGDSLRALDGQHADSSRDVSSGRARRDAAADPRGRAARRPAAGISTSDTLPSIAATTADRAGEAEPVRARRPRLDRHEGAGQGAEPEVRIGDRAGPGSRAIHEPRAGDAPGPRRRHTDSGSSPAGIALALATGTGFAVVSGRCDGGEHGAGSVGEPRVGRAVSAEKSAKEQANSRPGPRTDGDRRGAAIRRRRERNTSSSRHDPGLAKLRATLFKEPADIFQAAAGPAASRSRDDSESLARLAAANLVLGTITNEIGDKEDALNACEESLAIRQKLAKDHPSVLAYRRRPGAEPCQHRCHTEYDRPAGPGSCGVRARPRSLRRWRGSTQRSRKSRRSWPDVTTASVSCKARRADWPRRWGRTSRPGQSTSDSFEKTRQSPSLAAPSRGVTSTSAFCRLTWAD